MSRQRKYKKKTCKRRQKGGMWPFDDLKCMAFDYVNTLYSYYKLDPTSIMQEDEIEPVPPLPPLPPLYWTTNIDIYTFDQLYRNYTIHT